MCGYHVSIISTLCICPHVSVLMEECQCMCVTSVCVRVQWPVP